MRDVVVVGGGLAGLSAGWRLRHWDAIVLESDERVGGRIRSERRGPYLAELGRRLGNLDRYAMTLHGSGMVDEYPNVAHVVDWEENGYDGVFEENMVLSVESYIGEVGGREGVKLEQQVVLSATGAELMSKEPFVDALEI